MSIIKSKQQFINFLIKAKINTYASSGEGGEKILTDGSKELIFEDGNYQYRDRYFGSRYFIGEEVVWQEKQFIWGMNYYGNIISEIIDSKQIYQFLQKALKKVEQKKPFRGPDYFTENGFEYFNKVDGDINKFKGEEVIFYKKEKVYSLDYHGGIICK